MSPAARVHSTLNRLRRLRGRSLAEFRERAAQFVAAELEHRGLSAAHGEPPDSIVWTLLESRLATRVGRDPESLWHHFRTRVSPRFFAGPRDAAATADLFAARWPGRPDEVLAAADRVVAGRFDLLGYESLSFGSPVDWHLDPVHERRAPRVHWSRVRCLDAAVVGDHKIIWELNRHQHFLLLGRAYLLSGSERYAECVAAHLTQWMDANPPKIGMNWASSLEVAYRSIAWLWALELLRNSPSIPATVVLRALKYLHVHGRHLERYLSTYFSPNTHLTGEALGL